MVPSVLSTVFICLQETDFWQNSTDCNRRSWIYFCSPNTNHSAHLNRTRLADLLHNNWADPLLDRQQSLTCHLEQPFSIFLPWRNPWNNFQVSGNPCIKFIISTAHGTLAWSVSCRYNNPIIIVNALLSREWYFSVDRFILANKFKKQCFFFNHDLSRNP
jgi:hypothetical protein